VLVRKSSEKDKDLLQSENRKLDFDKSALDAADTPKFTITDNNHEIPNLSHKCQQNLNEKTDINITKLE
jgi:hypothetical protein